MTAATPRTPTRPAPLTPRAPLLVLCAAMFLVLLDVSAVNVALPSIDRDLGGGTAGAQGVVDSYTVPLAALLLTAGALADRFSPRRCFAAGLAGFGVGSLVCAVAPGLPILLSGRVIQGIGAAAMLPASLALIGSIWTDAGRRARAIAVWSGISGSAVAVGPLAGGALVAMGGWRPVFAVNLPVIGAALLGCRVLPRGAHAPRRTDWWGAVLSVLWLGALITAVIVLGGGPAPAAGGLLALAAAGIAAFVIQQGRAGEQMVPRALWRSGRLMRCCGGSLAMNLVGNGTLLVLTFLLQGVQRHSAPVAGLLTLPTFLPLTVVPLLAGRWMLRLRGSTLIRSGFAIGVAGQLGLALAVGSAAGRFWPLVPGMVLTGVALGLLVAPLVAGSVAAAPAHGGLAGGLNNAARQTGTSLGVAVFGAVTGAIAAPGVGGRMAVCFLLGAGIWAVAGLIAGSRAVGA
ncbi:MFS transporter [Flexivirga sp. ID2601S]|uniref:MFS transporter n=1 Tax=Flexivirga aerilata TaxID=1656889 RepID=A0A849AJD8_9MICO|nr:MFS transporter [Flexivirga aerilata]NNG40489.1 MFS transporter [Flexivirga aerilata]